MARGEATSILKNFARNGDVNVNKLLDSVYALPLTSIENVEISHEVETTTGKVLGRLSLDLIINSVGRKAMRDDDNPLTVALVLGTPQRRVLAAHQSIGVGRSGWVKKSIELSFDWSTANEDAGESGGAIILRLMLEEIRGLDAEVVLSLRQKTQT